MNRIKKKDIIIFITISLFVLSSTLIKSVDNLDEMWNFNFARCIANNLLPYKDFNIIQGPFLPYIVSIFLKIFGQEMLVTRILCIFLCSIELFLVYKIMDKLEIKDYLKYLIVALIIIIMKPYFALDYNFTSLLFILIIIFIEITKEESLKKDLFLGAIAALTITLKQTTGLVITITTIGWKIITIRNYEDLKKYIKSMTIRLLGALAVISVFFIIIIKLNLLNDYIDYCIKGILTFSNKISYIDALIKNKNILIKVLSISPILIYPAIICKYIKNKDNKALVLLIYSVIQMIFVYPISDESHFVIAIVPSIISLGYIISNTIKIPTKIELYINNFILCFIILFSITCFLVFMKDFKNQNINMELNHFKNLPMNKFLIEDVKKIDEYILLNEKKVYILDASAAVYMIPIDKYNKNYDMFLKGNLGSKGEKGQIENINKEKDIIILIKNNKYSRNWQNPELVRKYIMNNMKKTGEIGMFDIYE